MPERSDSFVASVVNALTVATYTSRIHSSASRIRIVPTRSVPLRYQTLIVHNT